MYTWNIEEGIAFCMAFLAREAAKASARPAARALGGAAHGAHRLPGASLSVAQGGLAGAALRVQEPTEMIDSQGMIHLPAIVLKSMGGLEFLEDSLFHGKKQRQMAEGRTDAQGTNVYGYMSVVDAGAALLFEDSCSARRWAMNKNLVNTQIARSLTFIPSGNANVSLLYCLNYFEMFLNLCKRLTNIQM